MYQQARKTKIFEITQFAPTIITCKILALHFTILTMVASLNWICQLAGGTSI